MDQMLLESMQHRVPVFSSTEGIACIREVRKEVDRKERSTAYREFLDTFKMELAEYDRQLDNNLSNFMHLVERIRETSDIAEKSKIREVIKTFCDSEPEYFEMWIDNGIWNYKAKVLRYQNRKIDEGLYIASFR